MGTTLKLGLVDSDSIPEDLKVFFKPFHGHLAENLREKLQFRDEANSEWKKFKEIKGEEVKTLQSFLIEKGFMPHSKADGVFGYITNAGARLFQEYVRTVEMHSDIGKPDGIVGRKTWQHIDRWKKEGVVCEWNNHALTPSDEYQRWMGLLENAKTHYLNEPNMSHTHLNAFPKESDSIKVQNWDFDPNAVHLIGIRRNQNKSQYRRDLDDVFVLLINGMVFKFWGSTDPSPRQTERSGFPFEAFLIEGQHKYRFGWHRRSSSSVVYKALCPAEKGVMVYRDYENDNALNLADMQSGLRGPNTTINIHWSGIGSSNYSAGCQVIAGRSYINHLDTPIDCQEFAAKNYSELNTKTRGAYNVISDLVAAYHSKDTNLVYYTLLHESALELDEAFGALYGADTLDRLKNAGQPMV